MKSKARPRKRPPAAKRAADFKGIDFFLLKCFDYKRARADLTRAEPKRRLFHFNKFDFYADLFCPVDHMEDGGFGNVGYPRNIADRTPARPLRCAGFFLQGKPSFSLEKRFSFCRKASAACCCIKP